MTNRPLRDEEIVQAKALLISNKKVEAVVLVRKATGCGLKEAVDLLRQWPEYCCTRTDPTDTEALLRDAKSSKVA